MILSVVVPRLQKGQWERIEEELKDIEYELIAHRDPIKALSLCTGRFLVFLEEDASFEPGSLATSLGLFLYNPAYRKLAMVSPAVDYDSLDELVGFAYDKQLELSTVHGNDPYPISVGYMYGAIIRTTVFKKAVLSYRKSAICRSVQLSDYFWANGLRVEMNPEAVYYAPPNDAPSMEGVPRIKTNSESLKIWDKEFIL